MRKSLWMLGMAVAALTSCTQNEVVDIPESRVIGFDTFVGKDTRSVTTVSTATLTSFWVYCAKGTGTGASFAEQDADGSIDGTQHFFDAVEVTKNVDDYSYDHKYWEGAKNYRFGAYSNGNVVLASAPTFTSNDVNGNWGFTFDNYEATDKDLIVALPKEVSVDANATNTTHVNLAFNHMLARVQFVFYTDIDPGLKLKICSFKFNGTKTSTCTVMTDGASADVTPTWNAGTNGDYIYAKNGTDEFTIVEGEKALFECYVIPQSNQSLTVSDITIQTLNANNDVLHTNTFTNVSLQLTGDHTSWKAGTIYSYQAEIGSDSHEIHFKATVDSWDDPAGGDKNIGTVSPTDDNV